MKLGELIGALQAIEKAHGSDAPVVFNQGKDDVSIWDVYFRENKEAVVLIDFPF